MNARYETRLRSHGTASGSRRRSSLAACLAASLTLFAAAAAAQKEANNWFFGAKAGLSFAGASPAALPGALISTAEGCSAISDSAGTLLFYTDGSAVWNKSHAVMTNGTGLAGNSSATQSAIIVPYPGKDCKQYFIFTVDATEDAIKPDSLRYSLVEFNSGNPLGVVTTKNQLLKSPVSEKLTAVADAAGTGFWVIAHGVDIANPGSAVNRQYYAYRVDASGIGPIVTSTVGTAHGATTFGSQGQMKTSPDGKLIAVAVRGSFVEILNLNTTSGVVSGPAKTFPAQSPPFGTQLVYGLEFSPNSQLLYVTTTGGSPNELFQLNIGGPTWTKLYSSTGSGNYYDTGALQLGPRQELPNQRIYVARNNQSFLSVINNPNVPVSPGFQAAGPSLPTGTTCKLGLPAIIAGDFSCSGIKPPDCCDKVLVSPYPNDQLTQKYRTFEIFNLKAPASPICSVDVALSPIPATGGWQGGDLFINSGSGLTPIAPATLFIFPYKRIPTTGVISALSTNVGSGALKFNLGVDFSQPYSGTVTLTVRHCDGSFCTLTYGPWIEGPPTPGDPFINWQLAAGNVRSEVVPLVLTFAGREAVPANRRGKQARWLSVQVQNPGVEILAVENPPMQETRASAATRARIKSSSMGQRFALFEFSTPLEMSAGTQAGLKVTVVVKKQADADFQPRLLVTLYDEDGNVIVAGRPNTLLP